MRAHTETELCRPRVAMQVATPVVVPPKARYNAETANSPKRSRETLQRETSQMFQNQQN